MSDFDPAEIHLGTHPNQITQRDGHDRPAHHEGPRFFEGVLEGGRGKSEMIRFRHQNL
jgi:hypothetical protein